MKILLSSKLLAYKLNDFDFDKEHIEKVKIRNGRLYICSHTRCRILFVESNSKKESCKQTNRRWDWIKDVVSNISDMPILLNINENNTKILMDF